MGSVYLVSDGELNYYGSTEMTLDKRFMSHKTTSNSCRSYLLNKDKMEIVEVEWVEDVTKLELREKWWIQNNECVNYKLPFATREEKLAQHAIRSKRYYENNKKECGRRSYEGQKRRDAERGDYECVCGAVVRDSDKRRHHKSKRHINFMMG